MAAAPLPATAPGRYDRVAIALHWLIGAALLAQIAFGFLLDELGPRGTPARGAVINLHKSCGLVLFALILVRIAWRRGHPPPALPLALPGWQARATHAVHHALYACMVVMPLSGYIASNFSKHGLKFFGIALAPWGPDSPAVYAFFNGLHDATALAFALLIAGHVLAALRHALIDRDGLFQRMWPTAVR